MPLIAMAAGLTAPRQPRHPGGGTPVPTPAPTPTPAAFAAADILLQVRLGQSNQRSDSQTDTAGIIAEPFVNFGDGASGPPILQLSVSDSAPTPPVSGWFNLLHVPTGQSLADPIQGTVNGPYGEKALTGAVTDEPKYGSLTAFAYQGIRNGALAAGAGSFRFLKPAIYAQELVTLSPFSDPPGNQYQNILAAVATRLRADIAAWRAAGQNPVLFGWDYKQGEAEASNGQDSGLGAGDPSILAWPVRFRAMVAGYGEKFGTDAPWLLHTIMRLPVSPGSPAWDPSTEAMRQNFRDVARYIIPMNADGTVGAVQDQGAGNGRLSHVWHLDHPFFRTDPANVHYSTAEYEALGKAEAAAWRVIHGSAGGAGALGFPVTRIAVIETSPLAVTGRTASTFSATFRLDEPGTMFVLAVPAGSAAPDVTAMEAATAVAVTMTGSERLGALAAETVVVPAAGTPGAAWDIYTMTRSAAASADRGPIRLAASNMTTAAATGWDTGWNSDGDSGYSNSARTATRLGGTGNDGVRGGQFSAGRNAILYLIGGTPNTVGFADATISQGGGAGQAGVGRVARTGNNIVHFNNAGGPQNTSVVGSLISNHRVLALIDTRDPDPANWKVWFRTVNATGTQAEWNGNNAAHDPVAGTGGLSAGGMVSQPFPFVAFAAGDIGDAVTIAALTDWTAAEIASVAGWNRVG